LIVFLKAIRAFLIRDALMSVSYRFDFFLRILSILLTIVVLSFISGLMGEHEAFNEYGGYLAFAVIGMAMMTYFQTGIRGFAQAIRTEQMMGTLEAMLMTPTKISTIIIASSSWSFFWASLTAVVYIVAASLLCGIKIQGNLILAIIVLVLITLIFASIGIISASFVMVFKRGDPLSVFFGVVSMLLGGVFYPVGELPTWLQKLSYFLPITHGLDGLRNILLKGMSFSEIIPQIAALLVFLALFGPLSLFCFKRAVIRAKREGTLVQY